MLIYFCPIYY